MTNRRDEQNSMLTAYHSFLIRMWKDGAESLWRASAQSIPSGEVVRFGSLAELIAYLETKTDESQHK